MTNMSLNYKGKIFKCAKRVLQGSILSAVLFNLLYVKGSNEMNFFLLGFADDLFIGIKTIKDYPKFIY